MPPRPSPAARPPALPPPVAARANGGRPDRPPHWRSRSCSRFTAGCGHDRAGGPVRGDVAGQHCGPARLRSPTVAAAAAPPTDRCAAPSTRAVPPRPDATPRRRPPPLPGPRHHAAHHDQAAGHRRPAAPRNRRTSRSRGRAPAARRRVRVRESRSPTAAARFSPTALYVPLGTTTLADGSLRFGVRHRAGRLRPTACGAGRLPATSWRRRHRPAWLPASAPSPSSSYRTCPATCPRWPPRLLAAGVADPRRLAAAGHSHGASAIATLALTADHADGRFRAFVVLAGDVTTLPDTYGARNGGPLLAAMGDADEFGNATLTPQVYATAAAPKVLVIAHGGQPSRQLPRRRAHRPESHPRGHRRLPRTRRSATRPGRRSPR